LGEKFPSETIEKSWRADIEQFLNNFNKIDQRVVTEKETVFNLMEDIWIMGYIDAIFASENQQINIIDWKTSSEFKGDKLKEAGRQLILYKLAIENTTNLKVNKIGWYMIKYINVKYNNKMKMCNRGKWVKQISNLLKTDLKRLGFQDFIQDMYLNTAIENNNLENMPQEIKNKYSLEDCIVWYNPKEQDIEECKMYIHNAVKEIESKNKQDETQWEPVDINSKSEFFCKNLCNHKKDCPFLKKYNEERK